MNLFDMCMCIMQICVYVILNKDGLAKGKDLVVTVLFAMENCKTCVILLNLMLY